ncbi:MAG: ATP phosphoribosyltransferase [Cryobacterium sp.]|nr:ATP phosphoribosyltransferase [Cryobacterium sp.]MBX3104359.1 ATP phosphoribosyltransferase [Cryobacterium sp.]
MLRIAIPNKGMLAEASISMLAESGYVVRRDPKELIVQDPANDVEFFYLRPRDIATYVGSGALDIGITGRDLLVDSGSEAIEISDLEFGPSTFRFAGPIGKFKDVVDLTGLRIATSYVGLVRAFLIKHNVSAEIIALDGAVESAVRLGVADAVADVVSTGTTLKQQGLEAFGPTLLESSAVLIGADPSVPGVATFERRMRGVLVARRYVLMDYDLPARLIEAAAKITPGLESPTISPLKDGEWVAVRVLVPRAEMNSVMDSLYELGAKAILVSAVHAARI